MLVNKRNVKRRVKKSVKMAEKSPRSPAKDIPNSKRRATRSTLAADEVFTGFAIKEYILFRPLSGDI